MLAALEEATPAGMIKIDAAILELKPHARLTRDLREAFVLKDRYAKWLVEILSKVVDGVSSGGFLSDAIDEGHAIDDLDDQLSPVQCSPLFLRGQSQLEDHR